MNNIEAILENKNESLTKIEQLVNSILEDTLPIATVWSDFGNYCRTPKVDILEFEESVKLEAEVPGFSKEELSIKIEKNNITISGEKKVDEKKEIELKSAKVIHKELNKSKFFRSFNLGEGLNINNIFAKVENGILNITIPKIKKTEPEIKEVKII